MGVSFCCLIVVETTYTGVFFKDIDFKTIMGVGQKAIKP